MSFSNIRAPVEKVQGSNRFFILKDGPLLGNHFCNCSNSGPVQEHMLI